ncbi:MAG: tRNA glutamyl-Q(34) synthetase GluQRS [Proteobacteria bacterium]|nr:tRNA glutamyl-Q(34) synthetase GluQRS [Pseudomonadota bacterium]
MAVTRFAPSPSGLLHLGHAYSALFAEARVLESGGRFLLRIEDIDAGRCRPEFEEAIHQDLAWLGLRWEEPVRRQSEHFADYQSALDRLDAQDLLYPCFCTRKQIRAEIAGSPSAPHGPDGPVYPGTCRGLPAEERRARVDAGDGFALRLKTDRAAALARGNLGDAFAFRDRERGEVPCDPSPFGDVVLARKDVPTSYHLAVTVDDALQGVTLVTRGADLFEATHVQRLLQVLLGLPAPHYHHHRLITDDAGKRLATRDKAASLRGLRAEGATPLSIRQRLGFD